MTLDQQLLAAHAAGDQDSLVSLYAQAAEAAAAEEARAFYLTQAYVFALATGSAEAPRLHSALVAMGREQ